MVEAPSGAVAAADLIIALAYFSIPTEIVVLWYRKNLRISYFTSDPKTGFVIRMLVGLFALFILLCGCTHLMSFLKNIDAAGLGVADLLFRITCAVISVVTAVVLAMVLPLLLHLLSEVEVTKRGLPREALTRYEMIMRYSLDVISTHETISESCSFLSVSPSVARLMGYSVDELLGRPLLDFVSRRDYARVATELSAIVKGHAAAVESGGGADCTEDLPDTTMTIEYRLRCKDGERKCVETGVSIGMEGQGMVLVLVTRDVGERKAQERERRERENLQTSMAVRQQYISSIAHDLKTPISTFQLALELLSSTHLDEEQAVLVTQAKVATEFMSVTIFQAMDFARMAADGTMKSLVPRKTPTNLRVLVDKCAAVLDGYPKQVPITFVVSADVAAEVLLDGDWVWQMLINLLTNACKFTADGHISMRISIARPPHGRPHFHFLPPEASGAQPAGAVGPLYAPGAVLGGFLDPDCSLVQPMLLFEVRDTGVGIPDKSKAKLFRAFGQAQRFQSQGTGLGLYSVAQKALKLGGTYGLLDNDPCGSNFFFAVPYLPEEDLTSAAAADVDARATTPRSADAVAVITSGGGGGSFGSGDGAMDYVQHHDGIGLAPLARGGNTGAGGRGSASSSMLLRSHDCDISSGEATARLLGMSRSDIFEASGVDLTATAAQAQQYQQRAGGRGSSTGGNGVPLLPSPLALMPPLSARARKTPPPTLAEEGPQAASAGGGGSGSGGLQSRLLLPEADSPASNDSTDSAVQPPAPTGGGGGGRGGGGGGASGGHRASGVGHRPSPPTVGDAMAGAMVDLNGVPTLVSKALAANAPAMVEASGGGVGVAGGGNSGGPTASHHQQRRGTILIIDDTRSVRTLVGKALDWWGFDIAHAANGVQGLEALKLRMYALVICDLQMPVLDGLECMRRFREWEWSHRWLQASPPSRRQILLSTSANCEAADMQLCIDAGADGFLPKPLSLSLLKRVVNAFVRDDGVRAELQDFCRPARPFRIYSAQAAVKEVSVANGAMGTPRGGPLLSHAAEAAAIASSKSQYQQHQRASPPPPSLSQARREGGSPPPLPVATPHLHHLDHHMSQSPPTLLTYTQACGARGSLQRAASPPQQHAAAGAGGQRGGGGRASLSQLQQQAGAAPAPPAQRLSQQQQRLSQQQHSPQQQPPQAWAAAQAQQQQWPQPPLWHHGQPQQDAAPVWLSGQQRESLGIGAAAKPTRPAPSAGVSAAAAAAKHSPALVPAPPQQPAGYRHHAQAQGAQQQQQPKQRSGLAVAALQGDAVMNGGSPVAVPMLNGAALRDAIMARRAAR